MIGTLAANLREARNKAGLSMDELAELLEVSKQTVYKYEKALLMPSPEALNKMSKVLGVKIEDLFAGEKKQKLEHVSFRSDVEQAMIKLANIEDEVIEEMELFAELEKLSKDITVFENPLASFQINKIDDVEKAAEKLREKWFLGEGPIANAVEMVEGNGITVIQKASVYNFEGFSAFYNDRPVIVLNLKTDEITRRRFTTLHELGHILLGFIVNDKMKERIEEVCNVFAGALLLPAKVLGKFWEGRKKFFMQDFISIKESYGISILAIWRRAVKLNLLSWETHSKWKEAYGSQTNYGNFTGHEVPRRMESLILRCISSGKIAVDQALEKTRKLKNNLDKTILLNMEYDMAI